MTNPEQESFFVIGHDIGGIVERDLYEVSQNPTNSIIERAIHLDDTLDFFSQVNIRRRFVDDISQTRPEVLQRRYGDNVDKVVAGAEANAEKFMTAAKMTFARAFGYVAVQASGEVPQDKLDDRFNKTFDLFWMSYGPPSRQLERKRKREQLQGMVADWQNGISQQHRNEGERPLEVFVEPKPKDDNVLMGTQERLQALWDDERAGFLPSTHHEKNMVLAFLDYQDNPAFKMGIRNQFLEIAYHQIGGFGGYFGSILAQEAMASRTYELEDMLRNAHIQLAALRDLEILIADCPNPAVTLVEEIGAEHPGFAPLVQFMDLTELRETGKIKGLKGDPLRTHRNEAIVEPELRGKKNKILENPYNRTDRRPTFEKRITKRVKELKIGDVRSAVGQAVANQEKRAYYMAARLRELAEPAPEGPLEQARDVAKVALQRTAQLDYAAA